MTRGSANAQNLRNIGRDSYSGFIIRWLPLLLIGGAMFTKFLRSWHRLSFAVLDDQLQHIIPFKYFLPNSLLARDYIIDFYISENGLLLTWLYGSPARLGIDPTSTAAGVAVVCILTTLLAVHRLMRAGGGSLAAAAATVVLMLVVLGNRDDIWLGVARTFGWPLLIASLWALVAARPVWFLVFGGLAGLIYPPVAAIVLGTAGLYVLATAVHEGDFALMRKWVIVGLAVAGMVLTTAMDRSSWGPMISADLARTLPEFAPGGRSEFFYPDSWRLYFVSGRSGLIDTTFRSMLHLAPLAIAGLFIKPPTRLLRLALSLATASIVLWALAHLLLFDLYLPSRFASYGVVLAAVLLAGHTLGVVADRVRYGPWLVLAALLIWPAYKIARTPYPQFAIVAPTAPDLHRRIALAPGRGTVGGLSYELNFVMAATGKPILWAIEMAQPYKLRYRAEVARQLNDASAAILSSDPKPFVQWARKRSVEWVLVDESVFRLGAKAPIIASTPGGAGLAKRFPGHPVSWLEQQQQCVTRQHQVSLFSASCLMEAAAELPSRDMDGATG